MPKYERPATGRATTRGFVRSYPRTVRVTKHIFVFAPSTGRCLVCGRTERAACHQGIK